MTAVLGGGRPNCVIVDEIDGATGGTEANSAVAALMKIIKAGDAAPGGSGRGAGKAAHAGACRVRVRVPGLGVTANAWSC